MSIWIYIFIFLIVSIIVGETLARFMRKKGDNLLQKRTGMTVEDYYHLADQKAGEMAENTLKRFFGEKK